MNETVKNAEVTLDEIRETLQQALHALDLIPQTGYLSWSQRQALERVRAKRAIRMLLAKIK